MTVSPSFIDLFSDLPATGPRSTRPQHTGHCWFRSQDEYPDAALVEAFVDGDDEFRAAFGGGFFPMSVNGAGDNAGYGIESTIEWETRLSDGPRHAERRYLLESTGKDMLFCGTSCAEGVVELTEMATGLAYIRDTGIVDFNDVCGNGSECRPWAYEVLYADNSATLKETVTARQAEHQSAESWMACAHYMDSEMDYAVFHAEEASGVLELMFSMPFLTSKPREGGFYRALLFWRDENTDKALPWHND